MTAGKRHVMLSGQWLRRGEDGLVWSPWPWHRDQTEREENRTTGTKGTLEVIHLCIYRHSVCEPGSVSLDIHDARLHLEWELLDRQT